MDSDNYDHYGAESAGPSGGPNDPLDRDNYGRGGWGETVGGWLGGFGGTLFGGAALGPMGAIMGGKAGYAGGQSIGRAVGNANWGSDAPTSSMFDRASDNGGLPPQMLAQQRPKITGPTSALVKGLPANFDTMPLDQRLALLKQMAQRPGLQNGKEFEAKKSGADVTAIGRNQNNGRRVFADEAGNLYRRKEVRIDKNGRAVPISPPPAASPPTAPTQSTPPVINAGGQTGGGSGGYYTPVGGTPPATPASQIYANGQPTPDWGYTPADMEYMTRAMGLGHLVDDQYGVEQLYFPATRPELELKDTGRYTKLAMNGQVNFAGGGHVQGPGTGTSDSIPAVIDGQYPAALSNNEFVFTESAVRGFGNGDPDRGASALQQLMKLAEQFDGGGR